MLKLTCRALQRMLFWEMKCVGFDEGFLDEMLRKL